MTTMSGRNGSIEFDDRGNGRWVPNVEVNTDETLIRILDVGSLTLVPDETVEVHRDGFREVFRSGC